MEHETLIKNEMKTELSKIAQDLEEEIKKLKAIIKEQNEQLRLHSVSNCIAIEYAEFCVRCDREKLPLLCLEDYIKQYCC